MTCAEVRESLSEFSLGLLPGDDRREVERHLEWCAGCRRESAELAEGVASVALSLPVAEPPASLEEQVVEGVRAAAGRGRTGRHRGARVLAVAALAAAIMALSAVQWGIAQHHQAESVQIQLQRLLQRENQTSELIKFLQQQFQGTGKLFQASLFPGPGKEQAGTVLIFSAPKGAGFVLVDVAAPLDDKAGQFTVNLVSSTGRVLEVGTLVPTGNGDHVLFRQDRPSDLSRSDAVELSQVASLEVLDRFGTPVLTGSVHRFIGNASSS